nr:unnamed protein product [Digitaria exilis]
MAQRRRQCGFPSFPTMRWLAHLAVMALICAASTTAQPQPQPLPLPTATAAAPPGGAPSLPAPCPPAQATLAPCLAFFTSNSSSPPAACCAQIRAMFQSQAPCLCAAMASGPAAQLGGLGSALGQLLPTSCDLPANACSGTTTTGGAAGPTAPSTTVAAAAPESGTNGVDDPAGTGAGGIKSVPGLLGSGAAAASYSGVVSAAAAVVSLSFGVYLL